MNPSKNLVIIEKYEDFANYIYLVLQNVPRNHGVLKEKIIHLVFEQVELFYKALKSNQKALISRGLRKVKNVFSFMEWSFNKC